MHVAGMPKGWSARVLLLRRVEDDGEVEVYGPLLDYMVAFHWRSRTWQDTVARAVGLFWDYTLSCGPATASRAHAARQDMLDLHFRMFVLALQNGTMTDAEDPSGLFWPRTRHQRAIGLARAIEDFARWRRGGTVSAPGAPGCDAWCDGLPDGSTTLSFTDMLVYFRLREVSVLKHLSHLSSPTPKRRPSVFDADGAGHGLEPVKFFPRDHAERLLWEGHLRPGREREPNEFLRFNVRDQMMALLDGWGGLRRSEGLHLWVGDVTEDPTRPGHALVVLNHPARALVEVRDGVSGRMVSLSREAVLEGRYGLRPRNLVKRGRYHAGWKGMDLDKHEQGIVHWIDERAAALFLVLYRGYLRFVRGPAMRERTRRGGGDHPFLFVSEGLPGGEGIGDPYSLQAYERNHRAAVLRMKLPYGKDHGTTTHGLRHMYGQTLADMRMPAQVIKKGLHHRSYLSQAVYVAPSREKIDETLRKGWDSMVSGEKPEVKLGGSEATQAIYRLSERVRG